MKNKWVLVITGVVVAVVVVAAVLYFTRDSPPTSTATKSYNVKNYGAYGDGVHNDEAANGWVVYFPAGNYLVTKSFILPPIKKGF